MLTYSSPSECRCYKEIRITITLVWVSWYHLTGAWSLTSCLSISLPCASLTLSARAVCPQPRRRSGTLSLVPSSAWCRLTGKQGNFTAALYSKTAQVWRVNTPQWHPFLPCTVGLESTPTCRVSHRRVPKPYSMIERSLQETQLFVLSVSTGKFGIHRPSVVS